jgi:hypothetical protein
LRPLASTSRCLAGPRCPQTAEVTFSLSRIAFSSRRQQTRQQARARKPSWMSWRRSDQEAAAVVQPGEGSFDDPTVAAEAGTVLGLAAGDDRLDAALPDEPPVLVVVVAAVGDQRPRSASWATDPAAHGWHPVEQLEQLGGVVAVAAGERPGERDTTPVYEQVVLAAATAPVDRTRPRPPARVRARAWGPADRCPSLSGEQARLLGPRRPRRRGVIDFYASRERAEQTLRQVQLKTAALPRYE